MGKTTLSQRLAQAVNAVHLRIDTIEQGLRDLCGIQVDGQGYRLAHRVASDNLLLGLNVVADSCNPIELTRREWEQVAQEANSKFVNIEIVCSNLAEHQRRVETQRSAIPDLGQPAWTDVVDREYDAWTVDRIVVDTAGKTEDESLRELLSNPGQRIA